MNKKLTFLLAILLAVLVLSIFMHQQYTEGHRSRKSSSSPPPPPNCAAYMTAVTCPKGCIWAGKFGSVTNGLCMKP